MKIVYVARHDAGGNRDEDAVSYALEKLGHQVIRIHEREAETAIDYKSADFLLFNKMNRPEVLRQVKIPKVFWYWDLVEWDDVTLKRRNRRRVEWMLQTLPLVQIGFLTDGKWVRERNHQFGGKMVWLTQGFDERMAKHVRFDVKERRFPISFFGIGKGGGTDREGFVFVMKEAFGSDFHHFPRGIYGKNLAETIAQSKIVVCPPSPVHHYYWSNRIYLMTGYGGFVLHFYNKTLRYEYATNHEVIFYYRHRLTSIIRDYLEDEPVEYMDRVRRNAHKRTMEDHTYRRRCERLIQVVQERL